MGADPIDRLESGWRAELPDLDTAAMATVARLHRVVGLTSRRIEARLADEGSSLAEFDVLSALRRNGSPYRVKPSELARSTMLSPSGMTHRLDQLEAAGLLERVVDPESRRTSPVQLTRAGIDRSERLARAVVDVEREVLGALSDRQRLQLDRLTETLLGRL